MSDVSNECLTRLGRLMTLHLARQHCEFLEEHDSDCILCENVRQELSNLATKMAEHCGDKETSAIWKLCGFNATNLGNTDVKFHDMLEFLGIDALAVQTSKSFQDLIKQKAGMSFIEFEELSKSTLRNCDLSKWETALAEVILAMEVKEPSLVEMEDAFLLDAAEDLAMRLDGAGKHAAAVFCFVMSWSYPAAVKCMKKTSGGNSDDFITFVAFCRAMETECRIDDSLPILAARLIGMGKSGLAKEILQIYASGSEQLVADALGGLCAENKDCERHVEFACGLLRLGKVKQPVCDALLQICRAVHDADFSTALAICSKVEDVAGGFVDEDSMIPVGELFGPFKDMLKGEI